MGKLDDDKIRGLLNETSNNTDFDVQWDAIEVLLEQKNKKKRALPFWLTGGIIGFILLGFAGIYFLNDANIETFAHNRTVEVNDVKKEELSNRKNLGTGEIRTSKNKLNSNIKTDNQEPKQAQFSAVTSATNSILEETSIQKDNLLKDTSKPTKSTLKQSNIFAQNITKAATINDFYKINRVPGLPLKPLLVNRNIKSNKLAISQDITSTKSPKYSRLVLVQSGFGNIQSSFKGEAYADQLNNDFKALSQFTTTVGSGVRIKDRLMISIGLQISSQRSVYRSALSEISQRLISADTSSIYTNSVGGNIHVPGELTETSTTSTSIQQYTYNNKLGLILNANYQIIGPIFAGLDVEWAPIQWEKGAILDNNQVLVSYRKNNKHTLLPNVGVELGYRFEYNSFLLDVGGYYKPQSYHSNLGGAITKSQSVGARLRLVYMFRK